MSPIEAIEILKSQPVVVLDEQACRNAEDDEPMAVVVLDIAHRDAIVKVLQLQLGTGSESATGLAQCDTSLPARN